MHPSPKFKTIAKVIGTIVTLIAGYFGIDLQINSSVKQMRCVKSPESITVNPNTDSMFESSVMNCAIDKTE